MAASTKIIIAEFDKNFLSHLSAAADAAALELFSNPKIYLHDPRAPNSCPAVWANAEGGSLRAVISDIGFAYHPKLDTTQLALFLTIEGQPKDYAFLPYASLVNDAYRNNSSRRYSRSLITSLIEARLQLIIKPYALSSDSDIGKTLLKTFSEVTLD